MTLSEFVKAYRAENGISQRQLARQCGLSHGTVSLFEREVNPQTGMKASPKMSNLKKLATGVGMTLQDLFSIVDVDVDLDDAMPDPRLVELERLFQMLDDRDIDDLLALARVKAARHE